jgi:hypothetical protein
MVGRAMRQGETAKICCSKRENLNVVVILRSDAIGSKNEKATS